MRVVGNADELAEAIASAKREAGAAFGNDQVLIEKYVAKPRHIEVQVFGDTHGNVVSLFERECTLQRRHQKVVEEAPAIGITAERSAEMAAAARAAAQAAGYVGAGTVEFIADASGFYFIEMNTRLQVEHPVTEMITGLDLVEWQLRVAFGESLPLRQDEIMARGHAIEARIYAEDADKGFLPATGVIREWREPAGEGIRVDTGFRAGDAVTPYYDALLAKLIAWGADRPQALDRMTEALGGFEIAGRDHQSRVPQDVADASAGGARRDRYRLHRAGNLRADADQASGCGARSCRRLRCGSYPRAARARASLVP